MSSRTPGVGVKVSASALPPLMAQVCGWGGGAGMVQFGA